MRPHSIPGGRYEVRPSITRSSHIVGDGWSAGESRSLLQANRAFFCPKEHLTVLCGLLHHHAPAHPSKVTRPETSLVQESRTRRSQGPSNANSAAACHPTVDGKAWSLGQRAAKQCLPLQLTDTPSVLQAGGAVAGLAGCPPFSGSAGEDWGAQL